MVAIPLSIGIGVWTAMRRDRAVDHVVSTSTLVLAALPEFVIGIGLILLFATSVFTWFPAVSLLAPDQRAWSEPSVVVLPAATLVLAVTPYISRIMRGSMIEVLESEYVTMARLKGLPERTVIWRHAVPNAIVPAIQVTALQLAWMAGGVVVVEFVFSYPGHRLAVHRRGRQPRHAGRADDHDAGGSDLRRAQPTRRPGDDRGDAKAPDGGAMTSPDRRAGPRPGAGGGSGGAAAAVAALPMARHPAQRLAAHPYPHRAGDGRASSC